MSKYIALAFLLSLAMTAAAADTTRLRNAPSCADWTKYSGSPANSAEKTIELSQQVWLLGYLSGLAAATDTDIPLGITNDLLYGWMDSYCKTKPQATVNSGAGVLIFGLREKGRLPPP
jgi:hypothetical protein